MRHEDEAARTDRHSKRCSTRTEDRSGDPGEGAQGREGRSARAPCNLFNITWRNPEGRIYYVVLPKELTQVDANIVVLYSKDFPTRSHKVGATYSVCMEHQLTRRHRARRAHARLAVDRQLRHRRRVRGSADGVRLARASARADEPGALRADRAVRRALREDARMREQRQGDLRHGQRAPEGPEEPDHEPVRGVRELPLPLPLHRQLVHRGGGGARTRRASATARSPAFASAMGSAGTIAAGERIKHEFHDVAHDRRRADPVPDALLERIRRPRHPGHRRQARHVDPQRLRTWTPSCASTTSSARRGSSS